MADFTQLMLPLRECSPRKKDIRTTMGYIQEVNMHNYYLPKRQVNMREYDLKHKYYRTKGYIAEQVYIMNDFHELGSKGVTTFRTYHQYGGYSRTTVSSRDGIMKEAQMIFVTDHDPNKRWFH